MPSEDTLTVHSDVTGAMAGTTIAGIYMCKPGSVQCVSIENTSGTELRIKFMNGMCEVGGTNEWGTGSRV